MLASEADNIELVEILLEAGADPNVGNCQGVKPVHLACKKGHDRVSTSESGLCI